MFLQENPFYILEVHSTDTKGTIIKATENKIFDSVDGGEERYKNAQNILINPRKRIDAEMSWLCGISKAEAYMLISSIKKNNMAEQILQKQDELRAIVILINELSYASLDQGPQYIQNLDEIYCRLSDKKCMSIINADRMKARIPVIAEEKFICSARKNLIDDVGRALSSLGKREGTSVYTTIILKIVESYALCANSGEVIAKCIDTYVLDMMENMTMLAERIGDILGKIQQGKETTEIRVLQSLVTDYARIEQPISKYRWHTEHAEFPQTRDIVSSIEQLSVTLYNESQDVQTAYALMQILCQHFLYLPAWKNLLQKDLDFLDKELSQVQTKHNNSADHADHNQNITPKNTPLMIGRHAKESIDGMEEIIADIKQNVYFTQGHTEENKKYSHDMIQGCYSRLMIEFLNWGDYTEKEVKVLNMNATVAYSLMAAACTWANEFQVALIYRRLALECAKKSEDLRTIEKMNSLCRQLESEMTSGVRTTVSGQENIPLSERKSTVKQSESHSSSKSSDSSGAGCLIFILGILIFAALDSGHFFIAGLLIVIVYSLCHNQ